MTARLLQGWGGAVQATAEAGAPAACAPLPSEWGLPMVCAPLPWGRGLPVACATLRSGAGSRVSSEPPVTPLQPGDAAERPGLTGLAKAAPASPSTFLALSPPCRWGGDP